MGKAEEHHKKNRYSFLKANPCYHQVDAILRDQRIKCIPRKDASFENVVYGTKINAKD